MPLFMRFVVQQRDEDSLQPMGVFQAASKLRDNIELPQLHRDAIERILKWFNQNLPTPKRLSRSRRSHALPKAISWFKESAADCLEPIRELNYILNVNGHRTERVTTERPGYVIYEDQFQIVAEPFRE